MLWPRGLAVFYPHAGHYLDASQVAMAALFLVAATTACVGLGRRYPYLPVGWLWYLGTLVPVIGLVQVGQQAMADRYTYVPLIGMFIILSWGAVELCLAWHVPRTAMVGTALALLGVCAVASWMQLNYWQASVTLWRHALEVTQANYLAHNDLGKALDQEASREAARLLRLGRPDEAERMRRAKLAAAVDQYTAALEIKSDLDLAWYNRGVAYLQLGRTDEAAREFTEALCLNPDFALAYYNRGLARARQGDQDGAVADFEETVRRLPRFGAAFSQLGKALTRKGHYPEAAAYFGKVLLLQPRDPDAYSDLGLVYSLDLKHVEALDSYRQAAALAPGVGRHVFDVAYALAESGQNMDSFTYYRQALAQDPQWAPATNRTAWDLATNPNPRFRNGPLALRLARQVCQATANEQPECLDTLAAAYAEERHYDEAAALAHRALAIADRAVTPGFRTQVEGRLKLYKKGQPYRQKRRPLV
jgi:tetratricopeptide (TPR) repeat protein